MNMDVAAHAAPYCWGEAFLIQSASSSIVPNVVEVARP